MQKKITKPSTLLNENGELIHTGYATAPIIKFCRKDVRKKSRLKEWDHYMIYNKDHAVSLTIGKSLNLFLIYVSIINLKEKKVKDKHIIRIVPEKFQLPQDPGKGNIVYKDRFVRLSFKIEGSIRILLLKIYNYKKTADLDISLILYNEPKDSIIIAAPFAGSQKNFYLSRKIVGMKASGYVRYKNDNYGFSPVQSFAVVNWSRGVWPHKTAWQWSAAAGRVNGKFFGFNLWHGSGDTSNATENILFYNGTAHKLENVKFHLPEKAGNDDCLKPWHITSSDNRIDMVFMPDFYRSLIFPIFSFPLSVRHHMFFGKFTGKAVLDDGTAIYLKEIYGFAKTTEFKW